MRQLFGAAEHGIYAIALSLLSAIVVFSCKESIEKTDALTAVDSLSTQTVRDMELIETKFGKVSLRFRAPLMESYSLLAEPFEIFPQGLEATTYTPEGELETMITANIAIHFTTNENERWEAYGNVVIVNHIEEQTLLTDTLYWDRTKQQISTQAFVKMFSPQGLMQGYGMESDEKAYNAVILRPFNSWGVIRQDTLPPPRDTLAVAPPHTPVPHASTLRAPSLRRDSLRPL